MTPRTPRVGTCAVALGALITFAILFGLTRWVLRPSQGGDLPQDYTSARAWLDGGSPYQPLGELLPRYGFPPVPPHVHVRYNPHPPGAVLLTLPYARTEFDTALRWVRWTQLAAIAVAWALAYRLFEPPVPVWAWAVAGGGFALWGPVWQGVEWGQPVGLLALLVTAAWALARTRRPGWFGLVLGFACAVRPFLAILVVVAAGWSLRDRVKAVGAAVVGGLVPFARAGVWPWDWYRLASDAEAYISGCGSLPGVLGLGTAGGVAVYAAAALALAYLRWRGLGPDATVALAAVAAMLTYPLAWFQYDTALIPVVAWVATRGVNAENRPALIGLVVFLLARTVPDLTPGPDGTGWVDALARHKGWLQVAARAVLLGAVILVARSRPVSGEPGG